MYSGDNANTLIGRSVKSLVGEIDFLSFSSSSIDGDGSGTAQFWDLATQQTSRTKNE